MSSNLPVLFFLVVISLISNNALARESGSLLGDESFIPHAFIQTGEELHYFTDVADQDIVIAGLSSDPGEKREYGLLTEKEIIMDPKSLEFDTAIVGLPIKQIVTVRNRKADLVFFAMSSTSIHFHCSFPEHAALSFGSSTTFVIYFLPLSSGYFENTFSIFTSRGLIQYHVRGKAENSPYRIQPISGVRMPVNGSFLAHVSLHNPHSTTLAISELASTSKYIHLELPGDELDEFRDDVIWEIAPFETRTIASARIVGAEELNTTAYISMKLQLKDSGELSEVFNSIKKDTPPPPFMVVPIEVKILKQKGLFSTSSMIDFGYVKAEEKSEQVLWEVYSTVDKSIDIDSIRVEDVNQQFVYIELATKMPIPIPSGNRGFPGSPAALAKLSLDGRSVMRVLGNPETPEKPQIIPTTGRIVAVSRGGNYNVSVPYKAIVYSGDLLHNPEDVAFYYKLKTPIYRGVSLTNTLPFGIAIYNISVDDDAIDVFKATLVSPSIELAPEEKKEVILLEYQQQQPLNFTTTFTIFTNVTTFRIPIVMFDGDLKIQLHSVSQEQFDFGAIGPGKQRSIYFTIINENPVQMIIRKLQPPMAPFSLLEVEGIGKGNGTKANLFGDVFKPNWQSGHDFTIPSKCFAVFKMTLAGHSMSTSGSDELVIQTEFAEYRYPVTFSLTNFSVHAVPQVMDFGRVFPGMLTTQEVSLLSTFHNDLPVDRVSLYPSDPRFFFHKSSDDAPLIVANSISKVAKVMMKPDVASFGENYVGLPLSSSDGQWFAYGMKLPPNLAEIDHYLYRKMRNRFNSIVNAGRHLINSSIVVDTPVIKNLEVPVKAELIWPRLLSHSTVHFPMTAVGNFTIVNLTLTNPSLKPVIVQLLPLVIYPDGESFLDFFRDDFPSPLIEQVETNETLMFSLRDTELFTLKPSSPVPKLREQVEKVVGSNIPRFTLSMILQPRMKARIRLGFLPSDYNLHSSLLIIRNNLTVIEPVVLYGKGAHIDVRVENKSARSEPSLFDIQPAHLKECSNPKRQKHELSTTLTLKRQFEVVNTGEISFTITNVTINNIPCENRGFHIINCHPFKLSPGESHFLDIAYTPDFLMSVNDASLQLYMHMNGTPWVFYIGATLPPHMLSTCHSALPRPPFENFMYYSCILALTFCLICVLACSYLEGDRMITYTIRQEASQDQISNDQVDHSTTVQEPSQQQIPQHRRRPSHYRHHVQASDNSIFFVRWFCCAANVFLWLFSMVWMRVRSDPEVNSASKKKKNKKKNQPIPRPENELNAKPKVIPEEPKKVQNHEEEKLPNTNDKQKTEEKAKSARVSKSPRSKNKENISSNPPAIKKSPLPEDTEIPEKEKNPLIEEKPKEVKKDQEIQVDDIKLDSVELEEDLNPCQKPTDLSDDEVPEWATEEVGDGNINDDYSDLVMASADMFSSRAETPVSTSSQSSLPVLRNRKSDTEFTTDDTEHSRTTTDHRPRRQKPTRGRKKDKDKETKRYLDMMTKKFRESLEEALKKGEKPPELSVPEPSPPPRQEENLSWPLSMIDQNQITPMLNMQQMYMRYISQWNQYQAAFRSRPYGYYEPMLDTLYENSNLRASPREFSSDLSSQPSGDQMSSFHNSQLGPIGARPNVQTSNQEEAFTSLYPSSSANSSLLEPTAGNSRQYSLFTGDDPIWQPLLDDLRSPSPNGWPDLKNSKSNN